MGELATTAATQKVPQLSAGQQKIADAVSHVSALEREIQQLQDDLSDREALIHRLEAGGALAQRTADHWERAAKNAASKAEHYQNFAMNLLARLKNIQELFNNVTNVTLVPFAPLEPSTVAAEPASEEEEIRLQNLAHKLAPQKENLP